MATNMVATLAVYTFVPGLRNRHGKIIMCNAVATMFVAILLLPVFNNTYVPDGIACDRLGYLLYFFTMAMFIWMLILCFDLCWAFVKASPSHENSENKKFIWYNVVTWLTSLTLTLIVYTVDVSLPKNHEWSPKVGDGMCFLNGAKGTFFHLPVFLIMLANVCFYILTIYTIYKARNKPLTLKAGSSRR